MKNINVGDYVEATVKYGIGINPQEWYYKGMIVEIYLVCTGPIAIIEQEDGTRQHLHVKHLKIAEGEGFTPTYTQLCVEKKVKANIKYSDDKYNHFEGVIIQIIPFVNGAPNCEDGLCSQAVIEDESGGRHNCALGHLYPIGFTSEAICY